MAVPAVWCLNLGQFVKLPAPGTVPGPRNIIIFVAIIVLFGEITQAISDLEWLTIQSNEDLYGPQPGHRMDKRPPVRYTARLHLPDVEMTPPLNDSRSRQYKVLSRSLTTNIQRLFADMPGTYTISNMRFMSYKGQDRDHIHGNEAGSIKKKPHGPSHPGKHKPLFLKLSSSPSSPRSRHTGTTTLSPPTPAVRRSSPRGSGAERRPSPQGSATVRRHSPRSSASGRKPSPRSSARSSRYKTHVTSRRQPKVTVSFVAATTTANTAVVTSSQTATATTSTTMAVATSSQTATPTTSTTMAVATSSQTATPTSTTMAVATSSQTATPTSTTMIVATSSQTATPTTSTTMAVATSSQTATPTTSTTMAVATSSQTATPTSTTMAVATSSQTATPTTSTTMAETASSQTETPTASSTMILALSSQVTNTMATPTELLAGDRSFNTSHLTTVFKECYQRSPAAGDYVIVLERYLDACTQLLSIFNLLGQVFSFAREDLVSKLATLRDLRTRDLERSHNYYMTIQSMFEYEHSHHGASAQLEGVSTNLWIQRALKFISGLIKASLDTSGGKSLGSHGQELYTQIMAPYQPWYIRTVAYLAFLSFPTREVLMERMGVAESTEGMMMLEDLSSAIGAVSKDMEDLYVRYSS